MAILKFAVTSLFQRLLAVGHRWTYRSTTHPKNVVVLGGSFAGVQLASSLVRSLPTGHRVVLIEKNSHFNYTFNFPRYSVIQGHERLAFIPYTGIDHNAPHGIFHFIQDTATHLSTNEIELKSGEIISFDYLAIATGATQAPPAKLLASDKIDACTELQRSQDAIKSAQTIAIVGGGAVGVEVAGDIKSIYPEKHVTLVHAHSQLLPSFGVRLHDHVITTLKTMGVVVLLNERPHLPSFTNNKSSTTLLQFKDGRTESFDLIIPCTGQRPNSAILAQLAPNSISSKTHRIIVKPTLQLSTDAEPNTEFPHIFALGDVAETGGPKMARAGMVQAEIVRANIMSMIKQKESLASYVPIPLEGMTRLTLGTVDFVTYMNDVDGDMLIPGKNETKNLDLEAARAWKMLGADMKDCSL